MALGGSSGGGGKGSASAIKAGEAFVELSVNDGPLKKALGTVANRIGRLGKQIAGIGAAAGAAGGAVVIPLLGLFKEAIERADNLQDAADRLETTTEAVSKLGYAAELSASSLEDIETANVALKKAMVAAGEGSKDQIEAFDNIGVSAEEFANINVDEQFLLIANALDQMDGPLEKNKLLFDLFGKSAVKLTPLFKDGAEGLKGLYTEAERAGAVLSSEDAANSARAMDALDRTWKAAKYTILEVGMSLIGFTDHLENGSQTILDNLKIVRDWIKENRSIVVSIAGVAAGVMAGGTALTVLGLGITGLVTGITTLITVFGTIIGTILSPFVLKIALISAAIAGLTYLLLELTGTTGDVIPMFQAMGSAIVEAFGGIMDALKAGNFALAGKIALVGLAVVFQEGVVVLTKIWVGFKDKIGDVFYDLIYLIKDAWIDFTAWFEKTTIKAASAAIRAILAIDPTGQFQKIIGLTEQEVNRGEQLATELADKQANKQHIDLNKEQQKDEVERRAYRRKQIQDELENLDILKQGLKDLVEQAKQPPKEKEAKGFSGGADFSPITKLADAVKGTFRSADYRGSLALGDGQKIQKDQLKELQGINGKLGVIQGKIEPGVFD